MDDVRRTVSRTLAEHRTAAFTAKTERRALRAATQSLADATEARGIVTAVAAAVQTRVHAQLAGVVTRALRAVFGTTAPTFRLTFRRARGRTECRATFVVNGRDVDPTEADSGGAVDVAAFALRLAALLLETPRRRRVIIADEPFRNVHGDSERERAAALIESLAAETGFQFIVSTGMEWLKIGKVIELGR